MMLTLLDVLVNVTGDEIMKISNPRAHSTALVSLTDLGLSRSIPQPPDSPLLTTRCGSEDYAAPEILLSQPYDGRSTDGWALGVLLYALMEGRLPFDPPPPRPGSKVSRARSRAAHRIARCDWIWSSFGDLDGEWDETAGKGWEGGREVVDGLLRKANKGRWTLDQVADNAWVKQGIQVDGGIRREHE
jgi:protein-serine/threonine kinase